MGLGIKQDGTRQPKPHLLSNSKAGTQPSPCFHSDLQLQNKTHLASSWRSSKCPNRRLEPEVTASKMPTCRVPGWGLRQAPTSSSLHLDDCWWCLRLFFFWHLQNHLTANWRNRQSSFYCIGKQNNPPAAGIGEERGMRYFQLSQCCVVAEMRNDAIA